MTEATDMGVKRSEFGEEKTVVVCGVFVAENMHD